MHALRCAVRLGTGAGRELRFTPDGVSALKPGRTDVRARIEYQCDNARTTAEEHRFGRRTNVCRSRPDPIDSTDPRVVRCGPTVWALLRTCSDWGVCVCHRTEGLQRRGQVHRRMLVAQLGRHLPGRPCGPLPGLDRPRAGPGRPVLGVSRTGSRLRPR